MREQDTGQREVQGGLFFNIYIFFTKRLTLAIYKQRAYIFVLEYTEQAVGARVFPVNNILL